MMLETDVLYAYIKEKDWLKPAADRIIAMISEGKLGPVHVSREVLHELYYVSVAEGVDINEVISRFAALTAIDNLTFLETTHEIDLLALALMTQYKIESIFDAYHAAAALNQDPDHTIISTDEVFDKIAGLNRVDPRELLKSKT